MYGADGESKELNQKEAAPKKCFFAMFMYRFQEYKKKAAEEDKAEQEAEAAAFAEISGNSNADTKSFEQMEADTKVDAELQRLMAEMGTSTSDVDLDAQLAALEQGGSL